MSTPEEATWLAFDRVSRCYTATVSGSAVRHLALGVTTLRVRRGEWVAVIGAGAGPLTLLRCAVGLVRPDTGRVRWLDDAGRDVVPPRVAMIHAGQSPYGCWSVRDALWAAASSRTAVGRAERRVEQALRCCGLGAVADRLVAELEMLDRWRVSVAAAVAGGARWLLLELPPSASSLASDREAPSSASHASLRRMAASLAALGIGATIAAAGAVPFPLHRRLVLDELTVNGEGSADPVTALARVAEAGESAWEPRPGTGVASPPWQV
ncbi:MAG TPA: ATP-binding cassette domain-containing protein [Gemmatimonadaceae bacterium]|nr:ATP-binding cassette domain-containing protein [Gemmatimonadaceae bacterium]